MQLVMQMHAQLPTKLSVSEDWSDAGHSLITLWSLATSYGIGAVLLQQDVDGKTLIAYASKTLNEAQKGCS